MINTNNNRTLSVPQDKKIVKIIVDEKGYQNKPKNYMGAITKRMTAPENACEVDLIQLGKYITSGHAFAISYAEGGMSDNNFISSDLVGLDFDGETTVNEVLDKLKAYNIPANIVYYTYSHGQQDEKGKTQERFRVITALDERITDKNEYKQIIKGYQFIFGDSTDNATVGAVQRFLGTNKGLARDVDPYTTASKQMFLELYAKKQKELEQANAEKAKQQATQIAPKASININGFDLSAEIDRYNLLDYIKQAYPTSTLKPASGGFYLNPCPLCNSNDHLHITGNKFHSFGNKNCLALGGVGIVQWLIYIENMTPAQAIAKFKYELLGIDEKQDKRAYAQAMALKEQEHNRSSAGEEQEHNQQYTQNDDKVKKPYFKIESLEKELEKRSITVKYNLITNANETFKNDRKMSKKEQNNLPTRLYSDLCDKYKGNMNVNLIGLYLNAIASKYKYNPVLDLFNANKWDGQDRLTQVYDILGIAQDDSLSRTLLLKWFWQGHAMLRNDEINPFGADGVLVLTGEQGIGKTSFFAHMAIKSEFFRDGQKIKSVDKDTSRRCITTWIAELGELDATFKAADISDLKAFITKSFDEYRLPYGREDEQSARRANLAATVNEKEDGYLVDQTGNRRFWTVPVRKINLKELREVNALQVWLQVWEQYAKHDLQGFRLTYDEQDMLKERNRRHEKSLKSEDEILDILDNAKTNNLAFEYMTVTEFKSKHDSLRNYSVKQIGLTLDKLGIKQERKRTDGKIERVRSLANVFVKSDDFKNL